MNLYGVQFHPEVDLAPNGKLMLHKHLLGIVVLASNYTLRDRGSRCMQYIRNTVGDKRFCY
jgi:GMP synthase (glutamine-hydrolysing)